MSLRLESVKLSDSDRFTPADLVNRSCLSSLTDSDRFTPADFAIESVKLTDSDRFTPADLCI